MWRLSPFQPGDSGLIGREELDYFERFLERGDLDFAYEMDQESRFPCTFFKQKNGLGAVFRLEVQSVAEVRERGKQYLLEKRRVQPVTEWSCGCIFKNPDPELSDGRSAGKLIDDCGGKHCSLVPALHVQHVTRLRMSETDKSVTVAPLAAACVGITSRRVYQRLRSALMQRWN